MPRAFFGAEGDPVSAAGEPTSQADFNRMRSARLGTLRINFNWGAVEPTPGAPRDWSYYDTMVERAARARVGILAVLVGQPAVGGRRERLRAAHAPPARAAFKRFVRDVVRRYGRGGSFWRTHPRRAAAPDPRLPGLERAELPAALVRRRRRVARDYASLLKLIGAHDPRERPQGDDRHRRPARQLHARARRLPLPRRPLRRQGDQALLRRRGHPPVLRGRRAG